MEQIASEAKADRAECIRKLHVKYPVDYPRALEAADALRVHLGLPTGTKATCGERENQPIWLAGLSGNVDPCGRPYVHVSLSQWPSSGGLRMRNKGRIVSTSPDGEVPELPKKVLGVPVFVSVSGCFGEATPGRNGEPCVDKPDPAPVKSRLALRVEELKKTVDSQLGDLGELSCVDGDDASLPSGRAWVRLVRDGDIGALGSVIAHTGLRATLIGAGLWAVGARRGTIVRDAVAGSLGVDAFILAWSLCRR